MLNHASNMFKHANNVLNQDSMLKHDKTVLNYAFFQISNINAVRLNVLLTFTKTDSVLLKMNKSSINGNHHQILSKTLK